MQNCEDKFPKEKIQDFLAELMKEEEEIEK